MFSITPSRRIPTRAERRHGKTLPSTHASNRPALFPFPRSREGSWKSQPFCEKDPRIFSISLRSCGSVDPNRETVIRIDSFRAFSNPFSSSGHTSPPLSWKKRTILILGTDDPLGHPSNPHSILFPKRGKGDGLPDFGFPVEYKEGDAKGNDS